MFFAIACTRGFSHARRFWPIVEETFKKLSLYFQYIDGADGLITLMRIIYEKALVDNSVLNARCGYFCVPRALLTFFARDLDQGRICSLDKTV